MMMMMMMITMIMVMMMLWSGNGMVWCSMVEMSSCVGMGSGRARARVFLMLSGGRGMTTKFNGARNYWAVSLSAVNHKGTGMTGLYVRLRHKMHAIKTRLARSADPAISVLPASAPRPHRT
jgi:hypothetical protein